MLNINLDQIIKGLDGKPILEPANPMDPGAGGKELKLRDVLVRSALFVDQNKNPTGEEKFKGFMLAQKIHDDDGTEEYSIEDMAHLKEQVGKMWMTLTVGTVWSILDAANRQKSAPSSLATAVAARPPVRANGPKPPRAN